MPIFNSLRDLSATTMNNLSLPAAGSYSRKPLIYWMCEDGSGTTLTDAMGHVDGESPNDGWNLSSNNFPGWSADTALKSASLNTADRGNYCLEFNGTDQFVVCDNTTGGGGANAFASNAGVTSYLCNKDYFSISMWIKDDDTSSNAGFMWAINSGSTNVLLGGLYQGRPAVYDTGWKKNDKVDQLTAVEAWHNVIWVVQRGDLATPATGTYHYPTYRAYVDGKIAFVRKGGDKITSTTRPYDGQEQFTLGAEYDSTSSPLGNDTPRNPSSPGDYYAGKMDEISIWDFLISPDQAEVIYNGGEPPDLRNGIPRWVPGGDPATANSPWEDRGAPLPLTASGQIDGLSGHGN
tara:strand:+ start:2556 stop:3602 length:1047 start_codon:yes stop_codon:yes gene_type:complete